MSPTSSYAECIRLRAENELLRAENERINIAHKELKTVIAASSKHQAAKNKHFKTIYATALNQQDAFSKHFNYLCDKLAELSHDISLPYEIRKLLHYYRAKAKDGANAELKKAEEKQEKLLSEQDELA